MKTRLLVPALMLAALPAAGGGDGAADLGPAVNAFAVDLYQALRADPGNLFFSPASVSYALGMTRTGARGATRDEMDRVLHLPSGDAAAAYGKLGALLAAEGAPYTLNLANRLYGQDGLDFRRTFRAALAEHFGAGFATVDFRDDPDGARGAINAWVDGQTAGKIPELLDAGSVTARTRLVLVNAIHFLADWRTPFPADGTRPQDFHLAGGEVVQVPMMHETASWGYAAPEGLQILALPYQGDALEMVVLLPAAGAPLADLEATLTAERLAGWLDAPYRTRVDVALPKFEFDASCRLARTLAGLGMPLAFGDRADFSGMVEAGGLAIDDVVHKAYVRVDEEGTEAAAATGVTMRATSVMPAPPERFVADRPFVFLIRHVASGAVLFLGRVADPRA